MTSVKLYFLGMARSMYIGYDDIVDMNFSPDAMVIYIEGKDTEIFKLSDQIVQDIRFRGLVYNHWQSILNDYDKSAHYDSGKARREEGSVAHEPTVLRSSGDSVESQINALKQINVLMEKFHNLQNNVDGFPPKHRMVVILSTLDKIKALLHCLPTEILRDSSAYKNYLTSLTAIINLSSSECDEGLISTEQHQSNMWRIEDLTSLDNEPHP